MKCKMLFALSALVLSFAVAAGKPNVTGKVLTIPNVTSNQNWRLELAFADDVQQHAVNLAVKTANVVGDYKAGDVLAQRKGTDADGAAYVYSYAADIPSGYVCSGGDCGVGTVDAAKRTLTIPNVKADVTTELTLNLERLAYAVSLTVTVDGAAAAPVKTTVAAGEPFVYDFAALIPATTRLVSAMASQGSVAGTVLRVESVSAALSLTLALTLEDRGDVRGWTYDAAKGIMTDGDWSVPVKAVSTSARTLKAVNLFVEDGAAAPASPTELDFSKPIADAGGQAWTLVQFGDSPAAVGTGLFCVSKTKTLVDPAMVSRCILPTTLMTVCRQGLENAPNLGDVVFPVLSQIGYGAFNNAGLTSATLLSDDITVLESSSFAAPGLTNLNVRSTKLTDVKANVVSSQRCTVRLASAKLASIAKNAFATSNGFGAMPRIILETQAYVEGLVSAASFGGGGGALCQWNVPRSKGWEAQARDGAIRSTDNWGRGSYLKGVLAPGDDGYNGNNLQFLAYADEFDAAFGTVTKTPVTKGMKAFVLMGQSNMSGRGAVASGWDDRPRKNFWNYVYRSGEWEPGTAVLDKYDDPTQVTLGSGFLERYLDDHPDTIVGVAQTAKGGQSIAYYSKSANAQGYKDAVTAIKGMKAAGCEIAGLLWHQGCSDTKSGMTDGDLDWYVNSFQELIANLKQDCGLGDVPVIVGELHPEQAAGNGVPVEVTARFNQMLRERLPQEVPNCACALVGNLPKKDTWHFDTLPAYEFGHRYYEKYLGLNHNPTGGDDDPTVTVDLDELSAEQLKASARVVAAEGVAAKLMAKSSAADITLPTSIITYPIYPDAVQKGADDGFKRYAEMYWRLPLGDFNGMVLIYCTADMAKGSIDMISPYLAAGYAVLSLDLRSRAMTSKNKTLSSSNPFTPRPQDVTLENVLADFSAAMAQAPAQAKELGLAVSHWGMVGWEYNAWIALATMTETEAGKKIEFANLIAPPVLPAKTDKNGYGLTNGLDEAQIAAKADLRTTTVFHPAQQLYIYLRTTTDAVKAAENEALVARLQKAGANVTRVDREVSDTTYGYYEGPKFTTEPIAWMQDLGYGEKLEELTEISDTYAATGAKLTVYIPKKISSQRTALLLVAGGGYASVGTTGEGPDSCRLMARKFGLLTGSVIYRSTAGSPKAASPLLDKPLEDATWAIRRMKQILKEKCGGFGAFGVMGFSAGGHVTTTVATRWSEADQLYATALSDVSSKPDFHVLFYPVVTMDAEFSHAGSRKALIGENPSEADVRKYSNEYNVTEATSPACVTVAKTDAMVPYRNSLVYIEALARKGVKVSYLEFEQGAKTNGGHGFADPGLGPYTKYGMTLGNGVYTGTQWNLAWQHALRWMQSNGWL